MEAAHFLESHNAQTLVIACNTATALALERITAAAQVPDLSGVWVKNRGRLGAVKNMSPYPDMVTGAPGNGSKGGRLLNRSFGNWKEEPDET